MPSQQFAKYVVASLLLTALLNLSTSALIIPRYSVTRDSAITIRAGDNGESLQTLTQTALTQYLDSQNVQDFVFLHGWNSINFAGVDAKNGPEANKRLFDAVDPVASSNGSRSLPFSDKFREYVSKVNEEIPHSTDDSAGMTKALKKKKKLCGAPIGKSIKNAVKEYHAETITKQAGGTDDPAFQSWLISNGIEYRDALEKCEAAKNKLIAERDKLRGIDGVLFDQALDAIAPITQIKPSGGTPNPAPETIMPIDTNNGTYVPKYSMDMLPATVTGWKASTGGEPGFSFDSSSTSSSSNSSTTSGGAHVGFIWEEFSGSGSGEGSKTDSTSETKAQKFSISFAGLSLVQIDRGIWFDDLRTAEALRDPSDNITRNPKVQAVFKEYFGTKDSPGPAAIYNNKALVAYDPVITVAFADEKAASSFQSTAASAEVCFLFICAGGSGASSKNSSSIEVKSNTATIKDSSKNAYIIGFALHDFWASQMIT